MPETDARIYVDETKSKGYLLAAATVPASQTDLARKTLRDLVLHGQRSLHMNNERGSRRHAIADTIARMSNLGLQATIYDAGRRYRNEKERRARCIHALATDAAQHKRGLITFDRDDSLVSWDLQQMIESTRTRRTGDRLHYTHAKRSSELLLAVPDSIAWCWARGGDWRRRVAPIIHEVREVYEQGTANRPKAPRSAEPERHGRPAGSRAHFLKLNATGNISIRRHTFRPADRAVSSANS